MVSLFSNLGGRHGIHENVSGQSRGGPRHELADGVGLGLVAVGGHSGEGSRAHTVDGWWRQVVVVSGGGEGKRREGGLIGGEWEKGEVSSGRRWVIGGLIGWVDSGSICRLREWVDDK